jgi:CheY-like chemotaxis protein
VVLVVDDHDSQRALFKLLADRLDITVHTVASGAEALEAIETYRFDAVLMDVQMPVMNGFECTKAMRKQMQGYTPIIAVTACVFPGDREKCLDSGMDDYLPKPFELAELRDKLDTWIGRKKPRG